MTLQQFNHFAGTTCFVLLMTVVFGGIAFFYLKEKIATSGREQGDFCEAVLQDLRRLTGQVTTLDTLQSGFTARLCEVETTAKALEARADQHRACINKNSEINDTYFREMRDRIMKLEERVGTYVAELRKKINEEKTARTAPYTGLDARVNELQRQRSGYEEKIISLTSRLSQLEGKTEGAANMTSVCLRGLGQRLDAVENAGSACSTSFSELQEWVQAIEERLDALEPDEGSNPNAIEAIRALVLAVGTRVDALSGAIVRVGERALQADGSAIEIDRRLREVETATKPLVEAAQYPSLDAQRNAAALEIGRAVFAQVPLSASDRASMEKMPQWQDAAARSLGYQILKRMPQSEVLLHPLQVARAFLDRTTAPELLQAVKQATSFDDPESREVPVSEELVNLAHYQFNRGLSV